MSSPLLNLNTKRNYFTKEGLASRQTLQPNYREKCIGMNYILLIIPNSVAFIKLTILRISALSGTCSVI